MRRGVVRLGQGQGEGEGEEQVPLVVEEPVVEKRQPEDKEHPHRHRHAHDARGFWWWGMVILAITALVISIVALVFAMTDDAHWIFSKQKNIITSRYDGADVEVREGSDLLIHNQILDGLYAVYERITLVPGNHDAYIDGDR